MFETNPLLRRANTLIRSGRPPERPDWDYTIRTTKVALGPERRSTALTFLFFRSLGCRYDRRGECTMCNYAVSLPVPALRIVEIVETGLAERSSYESLGISPFGNMFDPNEVPSEARRKIFQLAAATDCRTFHCESRPETIDEDDLAECVATLHPRPVFVNLGLECAVPWIQANCVGKSLDVQAYEACVEMMARHGARPVANILLGAPFLSEAEAIDSTVQTVRWALGCGTHLCVLFPSNIKGWTLQEWLWQRELYEVPSLWSLVETLRRLGPELTGRVALSWYATEPSDPVDPHQVSDPTRAVPTTCPVCRPEVLAKLGSFNDGGGFEIIEQLSDFPCACRDRWEQRLGQPLVGSLLDRVAAHYRQIGKGLVAHDLTGKDWWARNEAAVMDQLRAGYDKGMTVWHEEGSS